MRNHDLPGLLLLIKACFSLCNLGHHYTIFMTSSKNFLLFFIYKYTAR